MTLKKSATPVRKIKQATKTQANHYFFLSGLVIFCIKYGQIIMRRLFSFHGVRFYKSSNFEEDHLGQVTSCIKLQAVCG